MIRETSHMHKMDTGMEGAVQSIRSEKARKLLLPALKIEKVKAKRAEHREMLSNLFPTPVRLKRLMHDIEHNFAKEFASVIGSVDHAEERLAGLLASLKELAEKIELLEHTTVEEIEEHIRFDTRIHELFEDLILDCARFSLEEVEV